VKRVDLQPGPEAQWSADGQWWWDGRSWTQMWESPRGLAWNGDGWVRKTDEPATTAAERPKFVVARTPAPRPKRERPLPARTELAPAPVALPQARDARRPPRRLTWLVAAATVLILVGISSVFLANVLTRPSAGGSGTQLATGRLTPAQIAAALEGRKFTRDVQPPELADAAPLRDVLVAGSVPGLIGQDTTTTSDLGGTVTFYVFADPVWAEAFYETAPQAYGCGVCTAMGDPLSVQGVGDRATSYALYRKQAGGKSWVATTTYVLVGSVVIDGLYFPVNVSAPSPSALDRAVATAYTKAGIQLLGKLSAS
jgi:hypothetical protein